jgi:crotonobetainyl-CoA:carnitine CoA-transferase CaiB-like acyl-CoA transferase
MAALFNRERTGQGMHVESSLVGTALNVMAPILMEHAYGKAPRHPTGNRSPIGGPSDIIKTKDGWFVVSVLGNKLFARWAKFIGQPELTEDPRFADDALRGVNGDALSQIMTEWAKDRTTEECVKELVQIGLPAGPVLSPDDIMGGAMSLRESFFQQGTFGSETVMQMPTPIRFLGAPTRKNIDAPELGKHSREVLKDYGFTQDEIEMLIEGKLVSAL